MKITNFAQVLRPHWEKKVLTGIQEVAFANFTLLVVFLKENLS